MATTHQSTDASSPQSTELPGDDLFQQGYALYKQENYSQAIRLFQQAVALGNPDATYCLGYMHRFAQGTPMNINEAWRFFQMIPEHPLVMVQLGGDYLCGIGVNRDDAKGKDYYEQVVARYSKNPSMIEAEAIANACGRLARIYQYGSGVPIDLDKAIELYLKGCQYAITADFVNEYFKAVMGKIISL